MLILPSKKGNLVRDHVLAGELMRERLNFFVMKAFEHCVPGKTFKDNWHIDLICEYLEAVDKGEITRLIINVPPRFLKTHICSISWPAWLIGRNPSRQIMSASFSATLAQEHSLACRDLVQSDWYKEIFPNVILRDDQNTKEKWQTNLGGYRLATSVKGTATGRGGDILIGDDLISTADAHSKAKRLEANRFLDETFLRRLNEIATGALVLIMQRVHDDDPTAHLEERLGCVKLVLPAEFEKKTVLDFGSIKKTVEAGEMLHAERLSKEELERMKKEDGAYVVASQYLQNPVPLEGGMIKHGWIKRYDKNTLPADFQSIIQSWDTAIKDDELNDPSVCTTWGVANNGYYLLDVYRERVEYTGLRRAVVTRAEKHKPDGILIEDKASGQQLLQELGENTKLPTIAIMPKGDKIFRMAGCSIKFESGKVFLPEEADWLEEYEHEITTFPSTGHDDQVDSTSQFLNWITKNEGSNPGIRFL